MDKKTYNSMVKKVSPPSKKIRDFILAFLFGGLICTIGQLIFVCYYEFLKDIKLSYGLVSATLIVITGLLTGFRIFSKIAKYAGAGTLVPITGFANAVVSPAIEYKTEGFVLGVGANMFKIAGPVIVYGTVASVIYGIIYWVTTLF